VVPEHARGLVCVGEDAVCLIAAEGHLNLVVQQGGVEVPLDDAGDVPELRGDEEVDALRELASLLVVGAHHGEEVAAKTVPTVVAQISEERPIRPVDVHEGFVVGHAAIVASVRPDVQRCEGCAEGLERREERAVYKPQGKQVCKERPVVCPQGAHVRSCNALRQVRRPL
jgi:hypothetical protein